MKTLSALCFALCTLVGCASTPAVSTKPAATTPPSQGRPLRQPVVQLSERGAWGETLQSTEVPEFTLFEDGLVVFVRGSGASAVAMQTRLSLSETIALTNAANDALADMDELLELVSATDQPEARIGVTHQGRIYSVTAYGFGSDEAKPPPAFQALRDRLAAWDHDEAEAWTPDELEVVLAPVDDADADAVGWPAALPLPPTGARLPPPRPYGRESTVQPPMRYRVPGELAAELDDALADDGLDVRYAGGTWRVRYERVLPSAMWF
ncbi:MAG: hypothetical protein AAGA54_10940 [Myxococcota bacterium]